MIGTRAGAGVIGGRCTLTDATADGADGSITAISGFTYATGTITDND